MERSDEILGEIRSLRAEINETSVMLREHVVEWRNRNQTLSSLERDMWGDGTEGRPGVKIDVDRLKQVEATRSKVILGIVTTVSGLVATAIYKLFKP